MKKFIYLSLSVFILGFTTISCSSDDNSIPVNPINPIGKEIVTKTEGNYTFKIKNKSGKLTAQATSPIMVEIIDNSNTENKVFSNTKMNLTMYMTMANGHKMTHSAPITQLSPIAGSTNFFNGELMLTMAGTEPGVNYWALEIETENQGQKIKTEIDLMVYPKGETDLKTLQSFKYKEDTYLIAMHEIENIKVGDNSYFLSVYKNENHGTEFPLAKDFSIAIDPRMPAMANHGVGKVLPALQFNPNIGKYQGTITFNMTGYWYINLLVKNQDGEIVAGQFVEPESQINSDAFFEVSF